MARNAEFDATVEFSILGDLGNTRFLFPRLENTFLVQNCCLSIFFYAFLPKIRKIYVSDFIQTGDERSI